jgi:hypothetical protein
LVGAKIVNHGAIAIAKHNKEITMDIVILNGKKQDMEFLAHLMDDELREEVHAELSPCDAQVFLDTYCKKHFKKFCEKFVA